MAGLGGAAISGSAGSPWTVTVRVTPDYLNYDVSELRGAGLGRW